MRFTGKAYVQGQQQRKKTLFPSVFLDDLEQVSAHENLNDSCHILVFLL